MLTIKAYHSQTQYQNTMQLDSKINETGIIHTMQLVPHNFFNLFLLRPEQQLPIYHHNQIPQQLIQTQHTCNAS